MVDPHPEVRLFSQCLAYRLTKLIHGVEEVQGRL